MDDGKDAVSLVSDVIVIPGQRAPEPLREAGYQLWAWSQQQDCEKVAAALNAKHAGLDVDGRTVRGWCQQDGWRVRFEEERAELVPGVARYAAALQLQNHLPGAIEYVGAVANGTVAPNKDRLTACRMIIDACGFAAIRVQGDEATRKPADRAGAPELPDLAGLDADQLEAMLREQMAEAAK